MIILKGPPGSGKTTWAMEHMAKNPEYLLVSRDAIRESLVPNHRATWYQRNDRKRLENLVTSVVVRIMFHVWENGFDVILDETNPDVNVYSQFAALSNKSYIIQEMTTPIEECIRRDSLREYPVGEEVIRRIARKLSNGL